MQVFFKSCRFSRNHAGFLEIMRVFCKSCGFLKIMRVSINHAGIMLCYNLLDFTCKFSMEQQVFYMQYGVSVCNAGFLCSYRVIYKQVGSSM